MLTSVYRQIWRPTPDGDYSWCSARNFSLGFFDVNAGYAQIENMVRKILTARKTDLDTPDNRLYPAFSQAIFELQENYRLILKANGLSCRRSITGSEFSRLEAPLALSRYSCRVTVETKQLSLQPFENLPDSLAPWYLENINVFFKQKKHAEQLTLRNLLLATAALRCILYAQFGPESEKAVTPPDRGNSGTGYFTAKSIFTVQPPQWSQSDWYDISYKPPLIDNIEKYPF